MQINYESRFIKTFTIETGLVEKKIGISCRDSCSFLIVLLQNNICHTGSFKENYWTFSQENLKNAYITCSAGDLRIPSLPIDDIGGESAGYDFSTEQKCKSSYWYVLQQFGRLSSQEGSTDFSYESWKTHR